MRKKQNKKWRDCLEAFDQLRDKLPNEITMPNDIKIININKVLRYYKSDF